MNKAFLVLGITGIIIYSNPITSANAISNNDIQITTTKSLERTAGLIRRCNISISGSEKKLKISGTTSTNISMKTIGYKNIIIEYSSDGTNWHTEKDIGDLLKSNSNSYNLNDYSVSVKGGYYYRVTCTHYAKESGLFGSSQSVDNTSNSVWIS